MNQSLRLRALFVSVALLAVFLGIWQLAVTSSAGRPAPDMDPEYAALMGETAKGGSAVPGPLEVGKQIWEHIVNPFYDAGPNDKGVGIQLAYSIARVLVGFFFAVLLAVPLAHL